MQSALENVAIDTEHPKNTTIDLLHDPTEEYLTMLSEVDDEPLEVCAKLDTGTDENWISERVREQLKLTTRPASLQEYFTFSTTKTVVSNYTVSITWYGFGFLQARQSDFRVAENASFDVIIGKNFLLQENIVKIKSPRVLILAKKVKTEGKFLIRLFSSSAMKSLLIAFFAVEEEKIIRERRAKARAESALLAHRQELAKNSKSAHTNSENNPRKVPQRKV